MITTDTVAVPVPIALVDWNNFCASCERVFQPELRGKPVVVLSNNDEFYNQTFFVKPRFHMTRTW